MRFEDDVEEIGSGYGNRLFCITDISNNQYIIAFDLDLKQAFGIGGGAVGGAFYLDGGAGKGGAGAFVDDLSGECLLCVAEGG